MDGVLNLNQKSSSDDHRTYSDLDILSVDYRLSTLESELDWTKKVLNAVCYWIQGKFGEDNELPIEILKPETATAPRVEDIPFPTCKVETVDLELENELGVDADEYAVEITSDSHIYEYGDEGDQNDGFSSNNNILSRKRKAPSTRLQWDGEDSSSSNDSEFQIDNSDSESWSDSNIKHKSEKVGRMKNPGQQCSNSSRSSYESRAILKISKCKFGTFYCPICNDSFEQIDPLIRHKFEIHPIEFSTESQLNQFTRKQLVWKCSLCPGYYLYPKKIKCINHIKKFHRRDEEFGISIMEEKLIENLKFEVSDLDGNPIFKHPDKDNGAQCPTKIKIAKTGRESKESQLQLHNQFEEIIQDPENPTTLTDKTFSLSRCNKCSLSFGSSDELECHNLEEHSWKCKHSGCNCIFICKSKLKAHIKSMHRDREGTKSICPTCGKSVKHLQFHINYVHSGPKYSCPHCPFKARLSKDLRTHRATAHGIPNPNHQ